MENVTFDLIEQYDYEHLIFCQEKSVGLKAIIAIHETMYAIACQYQAASVPT